MLLGRPARVRKRRSAGWDAKRCCTTTEHVRGRPCSLGARPSGAQGGAGVTRRARHQTRHASRPHSAAQPMEAEHHAVRNPPKPALVGGIPKACPRGQGKGWLAGATTDSRSSSLRRALQCLRAGGCKSAGRWPWEADGDWVLHSSRGPACQPAPRAAAAAPAPQRGSWKRKQASLRAHTTLRGIFSSPTSSRSRSLTMMDGMYDARISMNFMAATRAPLALRPAAATASLTRAEAGLPGSCGPASARACHGQPCWDLRVGGRDRFGGRCRGSVRAGLQAKSG